MQTGNLHIHESLEPLLIPIAEVSQYDHNPRNGDIEAIAESMEINGMYRPVYVQESSGQILAGNHTYAAALSLGATVIPVVKVNVTDEQAMRIVLADNRTADLGTYDQSQLVALMDTLESLEPDLALVGTGYTEQDLEALRLLADIDPDDTTGIAQWPTISFTIPPHVRKAYYRLTDAADSDYDRFYLLLLMAGADLKPRKAVASDHVPDGR